MLLCDITQFYSPVGGGVRRYLEEKSKHLRLSGDHHLLIVPGEKTERLQRDHHTLWTIESPLISRRTHYRALLNLNLIEDILEQEKPDLIESGDPYQVAWRIIDIGKKLKIPVVAFYHSHFPEANIKPVAKLFGGLSVLMANEISKRYVISLYNQFEKTLVPNPLLASLLESWGVKNTATVELGVDTSLFYPDTSHTARWRKKHGLKNDEKILLYIGRLAPEKNVQTLLHAFEYLHQHHPGEYHLLVIGDGTLRNSVEHLVQKTAAITWLSYCQNPEELASCYRAADLFVHPGVHETFGLVTMESQACGTPVITIKGSAMDRLLVFTASYGADENTPLSLARAIEEFFDLDMIEKRVEIAAFVKKHYDWSHVFKKLFSIYHNTITSSCR